jgi:hypothetical protein
MCVQLLNLLISHNFKISFLIYLWSPFYIHVWEILIVMPQKKVSRSKGLRGQIKSGNTGLNYGGPYSSWQRLRDALIIIGV